MNPSAMRLDGRCLWVAGDETATVERLVASAGGQEYGDQVTYRLAHLLDLPGEADTAAFPAGHRPFTGLPVAGRSRVPCRHGG